MNQEQHTKANHIINNLGLVVIGMAAILTFFFIISLRKTDYKVRETAAYTRVSNCVVSRLASDSIHQKEIEDCYSRVEKSTNIKLERFDLQDRSDN